MGSPTQGARISGGLVFVAGAVEPPGRVMVNDQPAALEGIAFRLLVRYSHPGRRIIRITAIDSGFRPARAWVAVCVTGVSPGRAPGTPGGGQPGTAGGPAYSPGTLRKGVPAGPALSLRRARAVRCPTPR